MQSKAAKLPSVSGSVSQNLVNGKNANPVVGGFQTQANFTSNYGISSALTLYNGGYLKNDIKSKALALQSANLSIAEAENNITLSITEAYLNILLAKENIVYLQDLLSTSQAQLKQGQQRYDAGSISRKDFVQLEAQVATDQYNLVTAQNNYRLNIVILKQVLQLPSSYSMQVAAPDTLIVEKAVPNLAEAQKAAQQIRPEIRNGEIGIQIAQTEWKK
ncbi:MAG: TolC family protein [Bacteroidota bacterium]